MNMRGSQILAAAIAATLAVPSISAAQDASRAVAGGGISAPGWMGKVDAREAQGGAKIEDTKLVTMRFLEAFLPHLKRLRKSGREVILCGDWNIAHHEIDLKNWRANRKNSGFLPEERAWLTKVFGEVGYVDVFRRLDPRPEQYTWWSNRGQAWAKNVGWRLDYQIATPAIAAKAMTATIYKRRRFSDHAPLTIDYDFRL
jgi:exodeoxyribonuclease-3